MLTYDTFTIHPDAVSAADLREEIADYQNEEGDDIQAARVRVEGDANTLDAVLFPRWGRVGIAWGGSADWADYDNLDDAIRDYLNDPETYASRN